MNPHNPAPYTPNLTPAPSSLRPHVLAKERLLKWLPWKPLQDSSGDENSVQDEERLRNLLVLGWDESTLSTYGSGLLVFHVFCDSRAISDDQRTPTSCDLLATFISSLAGSYSRTAVSNYISGVRAWHLLHRISWEVNEAELEILLRACAKTAPTSSKRAKRAPWTPEIIERIHAKLDLTKHLHVAVYACLTSTFYAAARLGELTVPNLLDFNPAKHPQPPHVRVETDRSGHSSTIIHIPSTKSVPVGGEDIYWTEQPGITDPKAALAYHLSFNKPPNDGHLFAYPHENSFRPLSRLIFLKTVNTAASQAGLRHLHGHGIRIGATLEYLLRGVSLEAMKVKGHWASDAFTTYLTNHAHILAQHTRTRSSDLHDSISRITIPQLRRR